MDNWLANYRLFWAARLHDLKRFVESQDSASTAQVENEEGER